MHTSHTTSHTTTHPGTDSGSRRRGTARTATHWRAVAAALGAVAALTGVTAVGAPPADATPLAPIAVFDPPSTPWASVRNLTSGQFAADFETRADDGFMVTDLEVDIIGGSYRVGAVWRANPDGRGWYSYRDLSDQQFSTTWTELRDDGFRLVDQETYVVNGNRQYAGVWIENVEDLGWASYRNVTSADFTAKFATYRDRGFVPIDIETYSTSDGTRYAATWVENIDDLAWRLHRDLTSNEFSALFDELDGEYRMVDVEATLVGASMRYAGIWVENDDGRQWREHRDMTDAQYTNRWYRYRDEGFRLDDYEKYDTPSGVRYAGIWRQNSARPDWALKDDVDALVEAHLDEFDVPGISVAVAKDGEFVYQRGFGDADIDTDTWMHSDSVVDLASISKAIGGTLLFDLIESGEDIDLDDPIRDHVPSLPGHHSYTVGQAASHRGCVGHYPSGFSTSDHVDTALESLQNFMDEPLVCTPGQYTYSTATWAGVGAVMEAAVGDPITDIVVDRFTSTYGLGTLRPEDANADVPHRVTPYTFSNGGNVEVTYTDDSEKVLGGGVASSATDLARFASKLMAGEILTQDSLDTMWTPPNGASAFAFGWDTGEEDGRQIVARRGAQTGSNTYTRLYPEQGVVVVVLTNRQNGGHSAPNLGMDISHLVIDDLD